MRFTDPNVPIPWTPEDFMRLDRELAVMSDVEKMTLYYYLSRRSLYFLMRYVLSTRLFVDVAIENGHFSDNWWLLKRCNEVQLKPDRVLDIWARFHWKSLIKTFALPIQRVLQDPDVTIAIFSNVGKIAKGFLGQIQNEFENNDLLKKLSYDPRIGCQSIPDNSRDLPRNSLLMGLQVIRTANPREGTIEAHGLIDSLPHSRHFRIRAYDDIVTDESVTTSDMIQKTLTKYEMSQNLGMPGDEMWLTGTFYAHGDPYTTVVRNGMPLRIHPCFEIDHEKSVRGEDGMYKTLIHDFDSPVLYTKEELDKKFSEQSIGSSSTTGKVQMLCDANAGLRTGFKEEWINYYNEYPDTDVTPVQVRRGCNVYILVDPAHSKKKDSDYTVMWVVGLGRDGNYYILDCRRDRMNLADRAETLFELVNKWRPIEVRYERYGLQADTEHMKFLMKHYNNRFKIVEVGGKVAKDDRIERLIPSFQEGRWYAPKEIRYTTLEGWDTDLMDDFLSEEYRSWPNSTYKDMMDALARIADPEQTNRWPKMQANIQQPKRDKYRDSRRRKRKKRRSGSAWAA